MILDKIVADKKQRLLEQKSRVSEAEMRRRAETCSRACISFRDALARPGISIIGEFKKASPSLGAIDSKGNLTERIGAYNESADAVSCLTEENHFLGNAQHLEEIRSITPLPILRKDFMIDPYQFYEARAIGADAVLLIAAILDDVQLKEFHGLAGELGMDVLVETHNEREMERALKLDAKIVGVNNRDLQDFTIRLDTTERLAPMVPKGKILVAESGIVTDEDVKFLKKCGADAFLIGRAFMESEHPRELALHWKSLK